MYNNSLLAPIPKTRNVALLADWIELHLVVSEVSRFDAGTLSDAIGEGELYEIPPAYDVVAEDEFEFALASHEGEDLSLEYAPSDAGDYEMPERAERDEQIEIVTRNVYREFTHRARAARDGYPYEVDLSSIELKSAWRTHVPYLFCLLLSNYGDLVEKQEKNDCRLFFEHLCTLTAKAFVDGDALRFGFPRDGKSAPKTFSAAVDTLASSICEGQGSRQREGLQPKDDKLDVVAWRHFPDKGPGKLVLFGSCATDRAINDIRVRRATELKVDSFTERWFIDPPATPIIRALFIPHSLPKGDDVWAELTRDAGIVFERCRISHYAEKAKNSWPDISNWLGAYFRCDEEGH